MVSAPQTYQAAKMPLRREPQYELEHAVVNGRPWDGTNELAHDLPSPLSAIYQRTGEYARRPCRLR